MSRDSQIATELVTSLIVLYGQMKYFFVSCERL